MNQRGDKNQRKPDWTAISRLVTEYVESYDFRGDNGDHTPTDAEKILIEDAIHGLFAEEEVIQALGIGADKANSPVSAIEEFGALTTQPLDQQIAWVRSMRDDHVAGVKERGEILGDGTAMIVSILRSLERLRDAERELTEERKKVEALEESRENWIRRAERALALSSTREQPDDLNLLRMSLGNTAACLGDALACFNKVVGQDVFKNAAPQENKAGAAPSDAGFKATDLSGRGLPNEPAAAALVASDEEHPLALGDQIARVFRGPSTSASEPATVGYPPLTPEMYDAFASVNCTRSDIDERITFRGDFGNFVVCYDAMMRAAPSATKDTLTAALEQSVIAIDDWLNTYAPDLCDEKRVLEARKRIAEKGTLAYIADVQEQNRKALYRFVDRKGAA